MKLGALLLKRATASSDKLSKLVEQANSNYLPVVQEDYVPTNVAELLSQFDEAPAWKYNIPNMDRALGGLYPGTFTVIFARPEAGKSLSAISLACAPNGWCEQGANVAFFYNEELAKRQMLRAISSYTGMTAQDIREDILGAQKEFIKISPNLRMLDAPQWTTANIAKYCEKHKPDIIIIDQLDKLRDCPELDGHVRLRQLYTDARELGKKYSCAVIGISQASVEAEGKSILNYSYLEGSRTGKASEADVILGIGVNSIVEDSGKHDNVRSISVCKNKMTGQHPNLYVNIVPQISRMIA
jgi:replicative DNA helicase